MSPPLLWWSQEEAAVHFERKLQHYMSICEPVCESEDTPFLKLVDVGHKIVAHNIHGFIPGRVMLLLANIHTKPRPIWMSRHGESQYNSQGLIGGDSPLRYDATLPLFQPSPPLLLDPACIMPTLF